MPPSLNLPKPVGDLHAIRKGNKVYLTWTLPTRTTDGQFIHHTESTHVCRSLGVAITQCHAVGNVAPATPKPAAIGRFVDSVPAVAMTNISGNLFYCVEVLNDKGQSAGLSNQVAVPAIGALPPPANVTARVTAEGVLLRWRPLSITPKMTGVAYSYRIYRKQKDSEPDLIAGEIPLQPDQSEFVDHDFEWEKHYAYRLTVVTALHRDGQADIAIEGDDSPTVTVFTHDIFPPSEPAGLEAVFSNGFIDLIWNPNAESDLAGYNVYRRDDKSDVTKINPSLLKTPAFRDGVLSAKTYFYSVSAVDVRGNESSRSKEAKETVP